MLYAGPYSTTARVNMTVLASDDDGETFDRRLLIWEGRSYYSTMQLIGRSGASPGFDGEVALLFERDGGNISVVRFDAQDAKRL